MSDLRDTLGGCSCHINPPCGWCERRPSEIVRQIAEDESIHTGFTLPEEEIEFEEWIYDNPEMMDEDHDIVWEKYVQDHGGVRPIPYDPGEP